MSDDIPIEMLEKLRKIRERTDLTIRPTKYLRQTIVGLDGTEQPMKLRYYQVQMILHLMIMKRFVVGDDTGLGKTAELIATLAYLWEKEPDLSTLILTKKSAVRQWATEFTKFTTGITTFVCVGTPTEREKIRKQYADAPGPKVLIMGYRTAVQDFTKIQEETWGVTVFDECSTFKTPPTQVHQICRHLSAQSDRCYGLTATLIKNHLVEGFGIYRVIYPPLFTHTPTSFMRDYCVVKMQPIGNGRQVPVIVGYRPSDVERFRRKIEPYYLGRPKHAVAKELPPLTTQTIKVGMSSVQWLKYHEALKGLLEINGEEKEVTKLTAVTYCQEITNHPLLIGEEGPSEKLEALIEMLGDGGDLEGEKVIVFTRFERMVGIGIKALEKAGIKCVRITGKENEDAREKAQAAFQDTKSDVKVIWITTAGNEAINLQAAKAIVFYDTPFSAGDFLQTLGRMIRIGSLQDRVLAIHLVAEKTIDEKVVAIMNRKMKLLEAVLGKRILGENDDKDSLLIESDSEVEELFDSLRAEARELIGA